MAATYRRPGDCHAVVVDGYACVYVASRKEVLILNETATHIWQLASARALEDVVQTLAESYAADDEVVRADVQAAVVRMLDAGALERAR